MSGERGGDWPEGFSFCGSVHPACRLKNNINACGQPFSRLGSDVCNAVFFFFNGDSSVGGASD